MLICISATHFWMYCWDHLFLHSSVYFLYQCNSIVIHHTKFRFNFTLTSDPGLTSMVYPGAVHSRFEHSLGVYWLAGEAINKIKTYQVRMCFADSLSILIMQPKINPLLFMCHLSGRGAWNWQLWCENSKTCW